MGIHRRLFINLFETFTCLRRDWTWWNWHWIHCWNRVLRFLLNIQLTLKFNIIIRIFKINRIVNVDYLTLLFLIIYFVAPIFIDALQESFLYLSKIVFMIFHIFIRAKEFSWVSPIDRRGSRAYTTVNNRLIHIHLRCDDSLLFTCVQCQ